NPGISPKSAINLQSEIRNLQFHDAYGGSMNRLLVFTLIASFGSSSMAFAGEGLVQSASRLVEQAGRNPATATSAASHRAPMITSQASMFLNRNGAVSEAVLAQEQPVISKSGMGKGKKMVMYLAIGVGFAGSAYVIDHHVQNLTPSSLGTRKD